MNLVPVPQFIQVPKTNKIGAGLIGLTMILVMWNWQNIITLSSSTVVYNLNCTKLIIIYNDSNLNCTKLIFAMTVSSGML